MSAAAVAGCRFRLWRESAGIVGVLVLWELLALLWLSPRHLAPTPVAVVATLWHHPDLALWPNMATTLEEAAVGWVACNAVGIGLAIVFVLVPVAEAALLRIALASYCMPVIAIAPILDVVLSGIAPAAVLAALSVVFTTLIGTLVGLRSADPASLDLVRAYGGGRIAQLRKVRIPAARPATFAALQIAGRCRARCRHRRVPRRRQGPWGGHGQRRAGPGGQPDVAARVHRHRASRRRLPRHRRGRPVGRALGPGQPAGCLAR